MRRAEYKFRLTGIPRLGTSKVRTIIASIRTKEDARPKIIGVGESASAGMRKGVVVDIEEMTKSIKRSVDSAERISGANIDKVFVSIGGSHVKARGNKGVPRFHALTRNFRKRM